MRVAVSACRGLHSNITVECKKDGKNLQIDEGDSQWPDFRTALQVETASISPLFIIITWMNISMFVINLRIWKGH